jgi:hypothetical protein
MLDGHGLKGWTLVGRGIRERYDAELARSGFAGKLHPHRYKLFACSVLLIGKARFRLLYDNCFILIGT